MLVHSLPIHDSKKRGAREQLIRTLMRSGPDQFEAHRLLGILNDAAEALEAAQSALQINDETPEK